MRYPAEWEPFARSIRNGRARGRCECLGACGVDHRTRTPRGPKERRCQVRIGDSLPGAQPRDHGVRLTVAHVCGCEKRCTDPDHVLALCPECHDAIDPGARKEVADLAIEEARRERDRLAQQSEMG